jgi:uncharacterized protein
VAEPDFVGHTAWLLRRPPDAPDLPEERLNAIQEAHVAHIDSLRAEGKLLASGPFADQADESLRGFSVLQVGLEEAQQLASQDPAVRAHRLAIDTLTWLTLSQDRM